ncbi:hypothetical protein [Stutzerimonas tarimensis]|uniref:Uncharacterized protein n=1 Tax=Stutzerimonas tarimensis TaxID=1507735 RepID=A0ABV7T0I9_9GAMM
MRSRAIIAGILSFSLLFTLVAVLLNTLHQGATSVGQLMAYSLIWVVPGYIASHLSGSRALLHGAVTGVVIGIASAFGIVAALDPPDGMPVSEPEVFLGVIIAATLLSALGALIGRFHLMRS